MPVQLVAMLAVDNRRSRRSPSCSGRSLGGVIGKPCGRAGLGGLAGSFWSKNSGLEFSVKNHRSLAKEQPQLTKKCSGRSPGGLLLPDERPGYCTFVAECKWTKHQKTYPQTKLMMDRDRNKLVSNDRMQNELFACRQLVMLPHKS